MKKNVAQGSFEETGLEEGFFVLTSKNDSNSIELLERDINNSYIQFHFTLKGAANFMFNNGNYVLQIVEDRSLLLYNPQRSLPIHLELQPHSWLVTLVISITKFHQLFSQDANYVSFLTEDNRHKK